MPYLQLAEQQVIGGEQFYAHLAAAPEDFYIFIPDSPDGSSGQWVREDYFDNLAPAEWERVMEELADYQPQMMNGIFSNIREKIAERRERKDERKQARYDRRQERAETGLFGGKIKEFIGGLIPGGGAQPGAMMPTDPAFQSGRGLDLQFTTQPPTFWERNKVPILVGAGLLTVGGIALAMRKKK